MSGRNYLKTTLLLATLSGLLLLIGGQFFGPQGLTIALVLAALMNLGAYFWSDKLAIRAAGARPVSERDAPELYAIVRGLAARAEIPMPRLYVSPSPQPNAFATGRNPEHAAVAVTQGILPILDRRELEGVLAHELSHVVNRDILISSVAATIGAAITYVAQFAFFFGGSDDDDGGGNPFVALLMLILAPIAAAIVQLAVSRSREFGADASGAKLTADPLALASALQKIEAYSRGTPPATVNPSTSHLFISNPFKGEGVAKLFSTHPPTAERVARLRQLAGQPRLR